MRFAHQLENGSTAVVFCPVLAEKQRPLEPSAAKVTFTLPDPLFAEGFDEGYAEMRIGVLLRQARGAAGLAQEQVAEQLGTKKSAISRIENHAENVTLATIKAYQQF